MSDARIPSITEMHNRAHERLRNAWREDSAPPVREAATTDHAPDTAGAGVRIDVASIPRVADLYARHAARALSAWRNNGDGVVSR